MFRTDQLLRFVLDPHFGRPRPEACGTLPWQIGDCWRVHFRFRHPGLDARALPLGNEIQAVWRYRVVDREQEPPAFRLRIEAEGQDADLVMEAVYSEEEGKLLSAHRLFGSRKIPLPCPELPRLPETLASLETGIRRSVEFDAEPFVADAV